MRRIEQIQYFKQIQDNIATAGQPSMRELENLADCGYQVVINLGLHDSSYSIENEQVWVEQLGMKYIHIPVVFEKPGKNDFVRFLNAMNMYRDKKIFVHCDDYKRVSVFFALYQVITRQLSQINGWNSIISTWEPDLIWESYFYLMLENFYKIKEELPASLY